MTFTRFATPLLLITAFLLVACNNPPKEARRIDPDGPQTITTVQFLDIQDATDAAAALSTSLLESGILGRDGQPSVIAVDRYINNTTVQIDRDEVMKKIRVTLNKAGVAQTLVSVDEAGNIGGESNFASNAAQRRYKETGQVPVPDYSLTFKIIENSAKAGDTRQTTYTFQMSLVDVRPGSNSAGLAVWEDETRITKQGKKPSVGW